MSRTEIVNAVIAKHEAPAGAEPAPDATVAPPGGASGVGSAPADVDASAPAQPAGDASASPGAPTIDHEVLQAKLAHDRRLRQAKALKRKAREESEAAEKARKEAEEAQKKWTGIGKDKTWLEAVKEAGHDPRKAFAEMQAEARRAGTPEAQMEAMGKAWEAKLAQWETEKLQPLQKTLEEITAERDQLRKQTAEQGFESELQRGLSLERYQPLLEEYDPPQLLGYAKMFRDDEVKFFTTAKAHNVPLTSADGSFTMIDILNVLHAVQSAHQARVQQRRSQSAAPHTSQAGQPQPPQAKPPVNGTVERNAGTTTIGNDLATSTATEADQLKGMTRQQRVAFLERKYANAR